MSVFEWLDLYKDFPSRQLKVNVRSTVNLETVDAVPRVVKPPGLQSAIDAAVQKYENSRVRWRSSWAGCGRQTALLKAMPHPGI